MSEIITSTNSVVVVPVLKNAKLAEHTAKAARIINGTVANIQRSTLELASILNAIDTDKLYADDGYKSTSDFAEKVLHIKAGAVSDLIKASRRFGDESGKPAIKGLEGQSAYNLAYLAKCSDEDIAAAVESGELSPNSRQSDIKAWARAHTPEDAPKKADIVVEYTVSLRYGATVHTPANLLAESDIIEHVKSILPANSYDLKELAPLKCEDGTSIKRRVYVADDDSPIAGAVVVYYKVHKTKTPKPPKAKTLKHSDFTREELLAMLAEKDRVDPAETAKAKAKLDAVAKATEKAHG